jgi:hypothetical protein
MYAGSLDNQMDDILGKAEIDMQLEERKRRLGLSEAAPTTLDTEAEESASSS